MSGAELERIADSLGIPVIDGIGFSQIAISGPIDANDLTAWAQLDGFMVELRLGTPSPVTIALAEDGSLPTDLTSVGDLFTEGPARHRVEEAGSLGDLLDEFDPGAARAEIRYVQPGWLRTVAAFERFTGDRWLELTRAFDRDQVQIGALAVDLKTQAPVRPGLPAVRSPADEPPSDSAGQRVWACLIELADAVAWTHLAVDHKTSDGGVLVALHPDQTAEIPVTPATARGGAELLSWWTADEDPNRTEALRHVLRIVTAARAGGLPEAGNVRTLAERQRIALARDRAAEVQRAIVQGQKGTEEALEAVSDDLSSMIEDSVKTTSALVVAVLGLVTLLFRTDGDLPGHLVVIAAAAVVLGSLVVAAARGRRISDLRDAVTRHQQRLTKDPLLPVEDRDRATAEIEAFRLNRRLLRAKTMVWALALATVVVATVGAQWVLTNEPPPAEGTPSTATTQTSITTSTSP